MELKGKWFCFFSIAIIPNPIFTCIPTPLRPYCWPHSNNYILYQKMAKVFRITFHLYFSFFFFFCFCFISFLVFVSFLHLFIRYRQLDMFTVPFLRIDYDGFVMVDPFAYLCICIWTNAMWCDAILCVCMCMGKHSAIDICATFF